MLSETKKQVDTRAKEERFTSGKVFSELFGTASVVSRESEHIAGGRAGKNSPQELQEQPSSQINEFNLPTS